MSKPGRMRFARLAALVSGLVVAFACGGRSDDVSSTARWAACRVNSECSLVSRTCCEICGKPSLDAVDAVSAEYVDEHHQSVCPTEVSCAPCQEPASPDLRATCRAAVCTPIDVRRESATACKHDADCRLRVTSCCECGGSTARADLIAVSDEAAYASLACDPQQSCPECAPVYPTDVTARCASDGHCEVGEAASPCSLPFDPGPCDAAMPVFAFVDGACVPRTYGGCQGNDNRFFTLEECMATCEGRPPL